MKIEKKNKTTVYSYICMHMHTLHENTRKQSCVFINTLENYANLIVSVFILLLCFISYQVIHLNLKEHSNDRKHMSFVLKEQHTRQLLDIAVVRVIKKVK